MKFLLIRKQEGRGCDYTIGCGIAADEIVAESWDDALRLLREDALQRNGETTGMRLSGDGSVERAWLLPLADANVLPVDEWSAEQWKANAERSRHLR